MDLLSGRWLWLVTAVLVALFALSAWVTGDLGADGVYVDGALILLNTVPLLYLRRNPLVVVLLFAVAYPLWISGLVAQSAHEGHVLQSLPTLLALYATGTWERPLWLRACGLVSPLWMMAAAVTGLWPTDPVELSFVGVVLVIVWALGVVVAGRRAYARELEVKTQELEAARHELAEQAVAHERSRIARELHDVVAHAMSVITVQAGVGGHLLESRPDRAAESLDIIERTGRDALSELRRMLVVLRPGELADAQIAPQPGIAELPALAEKTRSTGVRVEMREVGTSRRLPPGLDLAAYRVVQESLTNIAKHAPGASASVTVRFHSRRLVVEVCDDGHNPSTEVVRGQGLRGMAERVELYDGTLETVASNDGFRVTATFPLEPAEKEPA